MSSTTYGLGLFFTLLPCLITCVQFHQSPSLIVKDGGEVEIHCSHNDSSLLVMLWYQQKPATMTLIGYGYGTSDPTMEDQFKDRFDLKRAGNLNGSLVISSLMVTDSAVFFCAASNTVIWVHINT
ncbi:hypothetical protein DPEC_G00312670 [Dallia pectoralis]|uniref:Uncharacterized protein n=1 Tax=Dallia pectoralis TaxID=75939 RepID=A0ACC2FBR1_DALPE|nr:hypothetical protein DPEC_G00312670 [Dallia pectoralis]